MPAPDVPYEPEFRDACEGRAGEGGERVEIDSVDG